ncbi:MAG: aspartate aminotransferase family protein [Firmicutes bacterium]|nr:aspartate aminotransferase family protein [Bacillota bacterium]
MISRKRLTQNLESEIDRFRQNHPRSWELFERARHSLLDGVPMNWMVRWAGGFPIFVREGAGAHFVDVDGHEYIDFCLGDTGSMTGHAPPAVVDAVARRVSQGTTFMLPTEDAIWVGEELQRRFGLKYWQMALTATDANRFSLRLARHLTGRSKILVFNWCYHGTVDEAFITLTSEGPRPRSGNLGPPVDPSVTTKVVEFNDVKALEEALAPRDVAAVLTEPVLTNIGIVHPQPGFHEALRSLTRETGTFLIIDETHTLCAGPGGYTRAHHLEPDFVTIGKAVAGGIPGAAYGFSEEVAAQWASRRVIDEADTGGIGGTLAGNALSLAAMRATLEHVWTTAAFDHADRMAERFLNGVQEGIERFHVPWNVTRLGGRVEYWFRPQPAQNGTEAWLAIDPELDRYMHLFSLNRGILMTPFHNMALMSPATSAADVDRHTAVFHEALSSLVEGDPD